MKIDLRKIQKFLSIILLCLLAVFSVASVSAFAQEDSSLGNASLNSKDQALLDKNLEGVVRGLIWGVPRSVVLENEKGTLMEDKDGALFYLAYIRGLRCTIGYEFSDDKLWRSRIFIEKKYWDPQDRIKDLMIVQADLEKRFGKPTHEEFKWLKDTDKNWPDSWGWAILRGELFISIKWETEDSNIEIKIGTHEKLNPKFSVIYESRKIKLAKAKEIRESLINAPK